MPKMIDGVRHVRIVYTSSCSGCHETIDGQETGHYPYDEKAGCYLGAGCHECGYTGKRRHDFWMPEDPNEVSFDE